MSKQARIYKHTYSVPVDVVAGQVVNASTPQYFTGFPYLRNKTVKAISVMPIVPNLLDQLGVLFVLKNGQGEELIFKYPASDLVVVNTALGLPASRLRLFRLFDIDLDNSYYLQSANLGYGATQRIFIINFHY